MLVTPIDGSGLAKAEGSQSRRKTAGPQGQANVADDESEMHPQDSPVQSVARMSGIGPENTMLLRKSGALVRKIGAAYGTTAGGAGKA
jgi:hypothetical protein